MIDISTTKLIVSIIKNRLTKRFVCGIIQIEKAKPTTVSLYKKLVIK